LIVPNSLICKPLVEQFFRVPDSVPAKQHLDLWFAVLKVLQRRTVPQRRLEPESFPLRNNRLRKICLIVRHLPDALIHSGIFRIMHPNRFRVHSLLADEVRMRALDAQIVDPNALGMLFADRSNNDAAAPIGTDENIARLKVLCIRPAGITGTERMFICGTENLLAALEIPDGQNAQVVGESLVNPINSAKHERAIGIVLVAAYDPVVLSDVLDIPCNVAKFAGANAKFIPWRQGALINLFRR
jgi:hypothetical protein